MNQIAAVAGLGIAARHPVVIRNLIAAPNRIIGAIAPAIPATIL